MKHNSLRISTINNRQFQQTGTHQLASRHLSQHHGKPHSIENHAQLEQLSPTPIPCAKQPTCHDDAYPSQSRTNTENMASLMATCLHYLLPPGQPKSMQPATKIPCDYSRHSKPVGNLLAKSMKHLFVGWPGKPKHMHPTTKVPCDCSRHSKSDGNLLALTKKYLLVGWPGKPRNMQRLLKT